MFAPVRRQVVHHVLAAKVAEGADEVGPEHVGCEAVHLAGDMAMERIVMYIIDRVSRIPKSGAVPVGAEAARMRMLRRRGRLVGGGRSAGGRLVSPSATVMGCGGRRGGHAHSRRHA